MQTMANDYNKYCFWDCDLPQLPRITASDMLKVINAKVKEWDKVAAQRKIEDALETWDNLLKEFYSGMVEDD